MENILDFSKLSTPVAAEEIIEKSIGQVAAISALPIPFADLIAMTFIHTKMIKGISSAYGQEEPDQSKVILISLLAAALSNLSSELITDLTEQVGIDKVISESIIKGAIAGFITTIAAEVFCRHFTKGGTIESLGVEDLIGYVTSSATKEKFSASSIFESLLDKFNLNGIV